MMFETGSGELLMPSRIPALSPCATSAVEPLVVLRYFGPEVHPDAPALGAYRKNKF